VSFSSQITWESNFLQGPPHNWCLLPQLQVCLITIKNGKENERSKRKSSNEHGKSLSLVTKALCGVGRVFDLFGVLCNQCYLLYSGWKLENLDAMNGGVVGVFIAPTTKLVVWGGCCRTVRCASHVTRPLGSDRWSSDEWTRLAVRCATRACSDFCARASALNASAVDRWREVAVAPLAHRTVRCAPDMSGEL
jgi:hypothetical protein